MALFKKLTKEEKIQAKERERIHKEVIKAENEYRKEDKIPHEGAFVTLEHINKIYDNHVQAVYDFNLDIKPREFIVFVGPSGCGKSTTLRMIAGLENITYGNLFINGIYSNDLEPKDRDIAMVFQSYALYPHMSVFDNMAFGLKIRKHKTLHVDNKLLKEKLKVVISLEKELAKKESELKEVELKIKRDSSLQTVFDGKISLLNNEIGELKDKLKIANEEYMNVKTTPVLTKDTDKIRRLNNDLKFYKKSLAKLEKQLSKIELKSNLDSKEVLIDELKKNISLAKENIERTEKEIEYLENNDVVVYKYKHLTKREVREQVVNAAKILDLVDYLDRKPSALSGGQCQRVALGRAIVRNSKLFLMDEPLSNLDAKLRVQMRSEIVKLHNQLQTTTIYVTHDQTEAMTMASRIVVMSKGYIQQIGTPKEIYNHPANIFVASFIGSPAMNIFDCEYDNGKLHVSDDFIIELPSSFVEAHDLFIKDQIITLETKKGQLSKEIDGYLKYQEQLANKEVKKVKSNILNNKDHYEYNKLELQSIENKLIKYYEYSKTNKHNIKLGIRPEDIVRLEDRTAKHNLGKSFISSVIVPELLGHEYYVHFNLGDHELISKIQGNDNIQIGDKLELAFNMDFLHLFDDVSTKLIK